MREKEGDSRKKSCDAKVIGMDATVREKEGDSRKKSCDAIK